MEIKKSKTLKQFSYFYAQIEIIKSNTTSVFTQKDIILTKDIGILKFLLPLLKIM